MRATVLKIKFNGLVLLIEDGAKGSKEVWLPSGEWSTEPSDWEKAKLALDEGQELDVIPLPRIPIEGRMVVSRKNSQVINHVRSVKNIGVVRDMRIRDVARTLLRGIIGHETPAIITQKFYQAYIDWITSKELSQDLSDHAVLGRGDMVRGFIAEISDNSAGEPASVVIDISGYLDFMSDEISRELTTSATHITEEPDEYAPPDKKIPPEMAARISPVLLVDDNDQCRESIATMLERAGVKTYTIKNAQEAQTFIDTLSAEPVQPDRSQPFRLAILDPNLEEDSTDLFGLEVAAKLSTETDCRVLLMTGEVEHSKKLKLWSDLKIHGYIAKPFTVVQLIEEIQEAFNLTQPITLADVITVEERSFSPAANISNPRPVQEPGEMSIIDALRRLGRIKPGTVLHVFSLHPRSFRARSDANWGGSINWEPLRGKIAKSVIKDVAVDREQLLESDVSHNQPMHFWTLRMMKYRSFCGVPVYVKGKSVALIAFHPEQNAFDEKFVMMSCLAAEQVGRAMERESLYSTRRNEAELASYGMALASLAHELSSDMTALDANLKELGELTTEGLDDLSAKSNTMKTLVRIRKDVDVISTKTRILRGAQTRLDRVSVIDCLKQAATACRTVIGQDMKNKSKYILIRNVNSEVDNWDVAIPAASLIIIFFNLYLNAAQQIELASKIRKQGVIWHTLSRYEDPKGKVWARVRIHDTGPGIHYDDWERVFDPGYTTKPNGSGLGLYICRYLLKDLPASLTITSSVIWAGTTVTVDLPLLEEQAKV